MTGSGNPAYDHPTYLPPPPHAKFNVYNNSLMIRTGTRGRPRKRIGPSGLPGLRLAPSLLKVPRQLTFVFQRAAATPERPRPVGV